MAFITQSGNLDYLIDSVRIHFGDVTEPYIISDSIVRTAIVNAIKALQRRWGNRYQILQSGMIVVDSLSAGVTVPAGYLYARTADGYGYIPSGLYNNDTFRNPVLPASEETPFTFPEPPAIEQQDEAVIVVMAAILLRKTQLTSSADGLQSWSAGDLSYSNINSSKVLNQMLSDDIKLLESFFRSRLAPSKIKFFKPIIITEY